ncbi:MAG: response regulator [Thermomicrobiales bacterium]
MCRIVVVDDHRPFLEVVEVLIAGLPHCTVIGTAETAEDGMARIKTARPDVALVDVGLPAQNGFWLAQQVLAHEPRTRVILMSASGAEEYDAAAAAVGASAFIAKSEISARLGELLHPPVEVLPPATPLDAVDHPTPFTASAPASGGSSRVAAKAASVSIRHPLLFTSALLGASVGYLGIGETLAGFSVASATLLYLFWHRAFAHHFCGQVGKRWMWRGAPSSTSPHIEGRRSHSF